jgi:hypothetical protein
MALSQRVLTVTLSIPGINGMNVITLDASIDLKVNINRAALDLMSTCQIRVTNLSRSLRESLLSQFTAYNKRLIEAGTIGQSGNTQAGTQKSYINVQVMAGYQTPGAQVQMNTCPVFNGQVVLVNPVGSLPNLGFDITCYAMQVSKLQWSNVQGQFGAQTTFKNYVESAAQLLGINANCQSSYDQRIITNPGASVQVLSDFIPDINSLFRPNVQAFYDDPSNTLYVRDTNALLANTTSVTLDEFIDMPSYETWGVQFKVLFDKRIQLPGSVIIQSTQNPTLNGAPFVIYALEYDVKENRPAPWNL